MPNISLLRSARRAVARVTVVGGRPWRLVAAVALFAATVPAGSGCGEAFSGSGGAGGSTTTTSSNSTHTGGSGNSTTTGTGTSVGGGTSTGSGGYGGSATGATTGCAAEDCEHDPCQPGPPLGQNCNSCVEAVCDELWSCCQVGWDSACVLRYDQQTESCAELPEPVIGCNEQYGESPGYLLCSQAEQSCVFLVSTEPLQMACNGRCMNGGGRCLEAWIGTCDSADSLGCDATPQPGAAQYCSCTVGCDGHEPCPMGMTCLDGGTCQ